MLVYVLGVSIAAVQGGIRAGIAATLASRTAIEAHIRFQC